MRKLIETIQHNAGTIAVGAMFAACTALGIEALDTPVVEAEQAPVVQEAAIQTPIMRTYEVKEISGIIVYAQVVDSDDIIVLTLSELSFEPLVGDIIGITYDGDGEAYSAIELLLPIDGMETI